MRFVHFFYSVAIVASLSSINHAKLSIKEKLTAIRDQLDKQNMLAYIIPANDEHQSSYIADYDKRRAWLSGFTGSAGTAVVTKTQALLWTDSRYFLSAAAQLSEDWTLMKQDEPGVPSIDEWLVQKLPKSDIAQPSNRNVGQNAKFASITAWRSRQQTLQQAGGLSLISPTQDLVDAIWPADERIPRPNNPIRIHALKYTGLTWNAKIENVRAKMQSVGADIFVVTDLAEIAWLFNMRGSDIPSNPMFYSFAVVSANETIGANRLYVDQSRITDELKQHLSGVMMREYADISGDIGELSKTLRVWMSPQSSFALYDLIADKSKAIINQASPIRSLKAVKNSVEIRNIRECQLRESAVRLRHMHWLETQIASGQSITEKSSAAKLKSLQSEDELSRGVSFPSVSAVGPNAAIVHYSTNEGNDAPLSKTSIYLLDAGGQYEDCSTDITRTHHFGQPSSEEKFAYTKVLQGAINLANVVFPSDVYGRDIDVLARKELWQVGMDYGHGTGHGIGYYLSIHENPPSIAYTGRNPFDEPLAEGMTQSDEPGYYETGKFGIRLETDIETVKAKTQFSTNGREFLKFEPLTFLPFERSLIDECALTYEQVDYLNEYYRQINLRVGPKLANFPDVRQFMLEKTKVFSYAHTYAHCANSKSTTISSSNLLAASKSLVVMLSIAICSRLV